MGDILRSQVNTNALFLTPRSGSHSIAAAALQQWWPDRCVAWQASSNEHPAVYFGVQESLDESTDLSCVAVIVRDPVARFLSMCGKHFDVPLKEQLAQPQYTPLPQNTFCKYFKFENGLQPVADWLGITVPLEALDASEPADKPTLTPEQEARVREIYTADIALWESL